MTSIASIINISALQRVLQEQGKEVSKQELKEAVNYMDTTLQVEVVDYIKEIIEEIL